MDLDGEESIVRAVEEQGRDGVVVILGSPDAESAEMYAETVVRGDPTWAGPLAGTPLGLPVYHITEPEIKAQVSPQVYEEQVGLMDLTLDVEQIARAVRSVREGRQDSG